MKVLFLNLYDDPAVSGGGAEMTLHHLTQGLLDRGIEPIVLATKAESGLSLGERHGVRTWRVGLRNLYWPQSNVRPHPLQRMAWHALDSYNLAMQPLLRHVLEVEKPDVVSAHNLPGWSVASWATIKSLGIPTVQVLHDMYLICARATMHTGGGNCVGQCASCRVLRLPHRGRSSQLSAVVGVSRFILDRHLGHQYFRDVPIQRVIHNARDPGELGVDAVTSVRGPGEPTRIGYIGRLDPSKGIELLLKVFQELAPTGAQLWIAGGGQADYERALRSKWESDRVIFLGRVPQSDFYPKVDFIVVPSMWEEPLGMVVAEAMAFGKPVIGSRRGGIPEMVTDGENGILFEPSNADELVVAMELLTRDVNLRVRMGEAARKSARPFLNREAWVDQYIGLYKEMTARMPLG
jgi:glycosyltransferase involved in cell wall biosynthesis